MKTRITELFGIEHPTCIVNQIVCWVKCPVREFLLMILTDEAHNLFS